MSKSHSAFLIILFLLCMPSCKSAVSLGDDQLTLLIDGTVLPIVQAYCDANGGKDSFDVVLIEDGGLQKKLSKKYEAYVKCLKFENSQAIDAVNGVNIYKANNKKVYVNTFQIIGRGENKYTIEWLRNVASMSATITTVTLSYTNGAWTISQTKLNAIF